ncbi:MAG: hypothetical protein K5866_05140 [Treponema sp.]|nr:hypothetical protein [Treponema sp.]
MKKILYLTLALTLLFTSCQSTDQVQETQDSYQDGEYESSEQSIQKDQKQTKKKKGFSLFDNSEKYLYGKQSTLFTFAVTNPLKQQDAFAVYNVKTGDTGFASNYMAAYYMVFLDEYNHQLLEKAYNNYLSDFDKKMLKRDDKQTYKEYGKIEASLNWGSLKKSTPNNSKGECYIGYSFYKGSPYFTLTMFPMFNEYSNITDSATRESLLLNYYFTKSQMKLILENSQKDNLKKDIGYDFEYQEASDTY